MVQTPVQLNKQKTRRTGIYWYVIPTDTRLPITAKTTDTALLVYLMYDISMKNHKKSCLGIKGGSEKVVQRNYYAKFTFQG